MSVTFKQSCEVHFNDEFQRIEIGICPSFPSQGAATPFSQKEPLCLQLENGDRIVWTNEFVKEHLADQKTTRTWWNIQKVPQQMATGKLHSSVCTLDQRTGVIHGRIDNKSYICYPPQPVPEEAFPINAINIPLHYCWNDLHSPYNWSFPEAFQETIIKRNMCHCAYERWDREPHPYNCLECGGPMHVTMRDIEQFGQYCSRTCKMDAMRAEDEVPCQGCGSSVHIESQGEYRAGYYCSRACAYDIYEGDRGY